MNNIIGTKINRTKNGNIMVHDNKTITDSIDIAEIFNNHFINIGSQLSKNVKESCNPLNYLSSTLNTVSIPHFSQNEVGNHIISLKNSNADNIPSDIGKQFINIYIEPLTKLIKLSLEKGIFPNELKIILLFKSGSSVDVNNYRPISILSFFSKFHQ